MSPVKSGADVSARVNMRWADHASRRWTDHVSRRLADHASRRWADHTSRRWADHASRRLTTDTVNMQYDVSDTRRHQ